MSKIKEIEILIRQLVRVNESIVTNYDSLLLCREYKNTKAVLKELNDRKTDIIKQLENSVNELFEIRQNFITERIRVGSFRLTPKITDFEYKFNIPKSVSRSSRQYFCYISLRDKLEKEYDVISHKHDGYYILDITATLNLNNLLEED